MTQKKPDCKKRDHLWNPPDVSEKFSTRRKAYLNYLKAAEQYQKTFTDTITTTSRQPAIPELPREYWPYEIRTREVRLVEFQIPLDEELKEFTGLQEARIVGVVMLVTPFNRLNPEQLAEIPLEAIEKGCGPALTVLYKEGAMHDGNNRLTCGGSVKTKVIPSTYAPYQVRRIN